MICREEKKKKKSIAPLAVRNSAKVPCARAKVERDGMGFQWAIPEAWPLRCGGAKVF